MKRIITWALLMALVLSLFAGCGAAETPTAEPTNAPAAAPTDAPEAVVVTDEDLDNAIAYLKAFYKDVKSGTQTPSDYQRLGSVRIGLTAYEIVYTVDCDERDVKVVKGDNGMVTIDVNEESEEEVPYTLTATVTGTDGTTASFSWEHILPVSMRGRATEIIDEAYALEEGAALAYEATLTGEIISIDTPYSADYKNITVSIKVEDREDKPIMCYRMKGEGCDKLMPGDIITVSGIIKNYKGTIEFDAGCILKQAQKGENSVEIPDTEDGILKAAFDLKPGAYLPYTATLTGKVVGVSRYSPQYNNRTVSIICGDGYFIKCYRLKGEDIDKIWMDDIITVTGNITNYDGTIEFDAGSIMDSWIDKPDPVPPTDPAEIVAAAYKLSNYSSLPYYCTLTGKVEQIVTKWNSAKRYITVNMTVEGKTIQAYRMIGDGIEAVKAGDTITVWGMLKNYNGTIEFDRGCKLMNGTKSIVDDAYELEPGETMEGEQSLTGKVVSTEVSGSSSNTVITVSGKKDKPITCVGMTGSGYDKLEAGDTITVRGTLTNEGGNYQFKKGCTLVSWSNANRPKVDASNTQAEIVEAAKQLGTADRMYGFILNGTITKVVENYSAQYGNVTVVMQSQGVEIECYRLKGEGADKIGVGDEIRVSGTLINYNGKLEFTQGCAILRYKITEKPEIQKPATLAEQMAEAVARGGGYNEYTSVTQGKIIGSVTYHSSHNNHSFYVLDEKENIQVYCYAQSLAGYTPETGDTVRVEGKLTSYNGKAQFDYTATLSLISKADGSEPTTPTEPADGSTLTCAEANALGITKAHNTYTTGKYYVTGVITSIYNTTYGNMYINDGTGSFCVYGLYKSGTRYDKMAEKPQIGDTITVYASIGQYNGTAQMKNAELVKFTPAQPEPTAPPVAPTEPPVAPTVPATEPATVPPTPTTGEGEE